MKVAEGNKAKVLLIRLSSLGDIVLSTAAIEPLRAAGLSVSVATKTEFASLLFGNSQIEQVYGFDKKSHGGEKAAREALLAWAKDQGFSFVIDLQNSWRTWSWRPALRALGPVYALSKPRLREWLVIFFRLGRWFGFPPGGRAMRFRRAAELAVKSWGLVGASSSLVALTRLEPSPGEIDGVRALLPSGDFVALLPGSAWRSKAWPYFPELASLIAQKKVPVVVLGGSKDQLCAEVAKAAAAHSESRTLHGRTSLRESMAVLSLARWVIGNDTGMVHVAEALGKNVAMVEGPTHSYMGFSPYRKESILLGREDLLCRPCSKTGRVCLRMGTRVCLKGLAVNDVAARLREKGFPC